MMSRYCLLLLTVATLMLVPDKSSPAQSKSSATSSFIAVRDEWIKNWKSGNVNDLRKLYAPDAIFQPALGAEIQGWDAICDYLRQINNATKGALIVVPDGEDAVSGDLAYDSGFMHYWIAKTVAPIKGSYLMVLKRTSDGSWQIVRHAFAGISVRYPNQSEAIQ